MSIDKKKLKKAARERKERVGAGAAGFFLFGVKTGEAHGTEITEEDLAVLEVIGPAFEQGEAFKLFLWGLRHIEYLDDHFLDVLKTVEPYWGLVRRDGSHKPGWDVVRAIVEEQ